ncbi:MAG: hypothetical protein ABJO30_01950 [Hyphomicrobiales bacterium]
MKSSSSKDQSAGRLEETMRLVREREANSKVEFAQLKRDALLALRDDLADVINDIPYDAHFFDFRISGKEPARLWVDATTFVTLADETGNYRMLKETRAGRVLLCESDDRKTVGEATVHYIAERLAEWERSKTSLEQSTKPKPKQPTTLMDGSKQDENTEDSELFKLALSDANHAQKANVIQSASLDEVDDLDAPTQKSNRREKPIVVVKPSPLRNFIWFIIGTIVGALGLLIYAWNREAITSFVINTIDWVKTFV